MLFVLGPQRAESINARAGVATISPPIVDRFNRHRDPPVTYADSPLAHPSRPLQSPV